MLSQNAQNARAILNNSRSAMIQARDNLKNNQVGQLHSLQAYHSRDKVQEAIDQMSQKINELSMLIDNFEDIDVMSQ